MVHCVKYKSAGSACSLLFLWGLFLLLGNPFSGTGSNRDSVAVPRNLDNGAGVRIVLNFDMIGHEGGFEPGFLAENLVDEQSVDTDFSTHPVSPAWEVLDNSDTTGIYFDLGHEYELSQISFHHVFLSEGVNLYSGEPGNWKYEFKSESKIANTWKNTSVTVRTRYIKLKLVNIESAGINEIIVSAKTGDQVSSGIKNAGIPALTDIDPVDFGWHDDTNTPVDILSPDGTYTIALPLEINHDLTVDVFNMSGVKVYSRTHIPNITPRLILDATSAAKGNDVYILHYYNDSGVSRTEKIQRRR